MAWAKYLNMGLCFHHLLMAQLIFLSMLVHSLCLCIFKSSKFQISVYVWLHSRGQYVWEDHRPRNGAFKGTSGGEAFCFSGCDDHQTSADTSVSIFLSLPVFL